MSVVCSLLATCKAHKVNPRTYLNDVIARMPYMQKANYEELLQMLPHKWKEIKNDGDTTIDGCINSSFLD